MTDERKRAPATMQGRAISAKSRAKVAQSILNNSPPGIPPRPANKGGAAKDH